MRDAKEVRTDAAHFIGADFEQYLRLETILSNFTCVYRQSDGRHLAIQSTAGQSDRSGFISDFVRYGTGRTPAFISPRTWIDGTRPR